ncbi:Seven TM Receptor [Caenorhabditis elegans]|uniref:Seven TM Receptor n=1 Tax=Caenorhabditis elegans TaxID=6239 RepID=O76436_CAEEL|nr:Seven TM Receptor [Caenorhabditis elegans]CCD65467.1 Seven TM Receptor [Caenorhabditis elegans]|eukprot:NP_503740.1 Seven TM Receptor [Caenorhabditis elegans]
MSGSYLFWIHVTHFIPKLGFVATFMFGMCLLSLNYLGAQKNFGSYKYLITAFTMLGMTFATVEIIVYPNVHNYKASFLFYSFEESFGLRGSWSRNIPLAIYTFFHSATMSLLSVQFIYRYWAVFDTNKLAYFEGCNSLFWFFYCAFFGFQYALGTYFFLARDEITDDYLREDMLLRYNANITEIPAMAIVAYDPVDGSVRWRNVIGILNICSIVNFQYGVMIYCGWSMHTKMEDKIKNFSETLRKLHKQFFKTLVLQITAPTIILFIPITIIIFLPLFNLDVSLPSGVMLCSFALYPPTDSFIVMFVVSEYRSTAKRTLATFSNGIKKFKQSRVGGIPSGTISSRYIAS